MDKLFNSYDKEIFPIEAYINKKQSLSYKVKELNGECIFEHNDIIKYISLSYDKRLMISHDGKSVRKSVIDWVIKIERDYKLSKILNETN